MKKRVSCIFLVLCLTVGMFPVSAPAAEGALADVSATGLDLSVRPGEETVYRAGEGTIVYTPSDGTVPARVRMENAAIQVSGSGSGTVCGLLLSESTDLELVGDNIISVENRSGSYGIRGTAGTLTVSGDGNLTVQKSNYGINFPEIALSGGRVSVDAEQVGIFGTTVTVSGGAVDTSGYFTGLEGTRLELRGGSVRTEGKMAGAQAQETALKGGRIVITGEETGLNTRSVAVSGGEIEISGGYGIEAETVSVSGGTVGILSEDEFFGGICLSEIGDAPSFGMTGGTVSIICSGVGIYATASESALSLSVTGGALSIRSGVCAVYADAGQADIEVGEGLSILPAGAQVKKAGYFDGAYEIISFTQDDELRLDLNDWSLPNACKRVSIAGAAVLLPEELNVTYTGKPVSDSQIRGTALRDGAAMKGSWSFLPGQGLTDVAHSGLKMVLFTPEIPLEGERLESALVLTIQKAEQSAPTTVKAVGETEKNKADGKLTGLTSDMEYRAKDAGTYAPVGASVTELTLPCGTYLVRFREKENYQASPDVTVTIEAAGAGDDKPGEDRPGEETPGDDKPGEDKPGGEKPGNDPAEKPCDGGEGCVSREFSDVKTEKWYHEAVDYALTHQLMEGVGGGKFDPNGVLNRAMLCQILCNKEGKPAVTTANPFTDVKAGKWYESAVVWASGRGLVTGYGNGKFGPEDNVTREQLAAILYRYAGEPETRAGLTGFRDAGKVSKYAVRAMSWAVEKGIITGKGNQTLDPRGKAERCEVAAMVMRYLKLEK